MKLGILLSLGESLENYARFGQDIRFTKYYLGNYSKKFDEVLVFSYLKERYSSLPSNCRLVCPQNKIHRYFYGLLLPLIKFKDYRNCDIFRCFHPNASLPAIIGKILWGKKFIFNYNYSYMNWAKIEGKSYLVPFLFIQQWLAFKFCDGVFISDEKMKKYVEKYVSKKKTTIIRNGVDPGAFRPIPSNNKNKEKIILSVGRLEIQKNYGQLIEAVSMLKAGYILRIVGRGSLEKQLREQAMKQGVKLEIIESVPNDQLPLIYNQAVVYVQPSLMEAPVKTLLEAMSCACPCVGTNVPGIRDMINSGEDGILVNLSSVEIKKGIESILNNSLLAKRIGKNARKKIISKHNLQKFIQLETKILLSV